jgi:hypothetical protein
MPTRKRTKGGRFESSTIATNTTMKTKKVDTEKSHPVITKDHPVVQKILAYIKKEITPEPIEITRHLRYRRYLGTLDEDELVIYALYKRVRSIPAIYEYHNSKQLSESDSNKMFNLLGSEF